MRSHLRRFASTTLILAPIMFALLYGLVWLNDHVARWVYWKVGLILLVAGEIAYGVVLGAAVLGTLALGLMLRTRNRPPVQRRSLMRGLVVCLSLVGALLGAEVVAALWQSFTSRAAALPAERARRKGTARGASTPGNPVELPRKFEALPTGRNRDLHFVILGESSAEGVPFSYWLSIGTILQWQLERLLERPVSHRTLAFSGSTLERQHRELARLDRRPDAVVVFCGHNEFSARFAWSRDLRYYLDDDEPTPWQKFVEHAEQVSPLCSLLRKTADKCRVAIPPPAAGHRDLIDTPAYTVLEASTLRSDFRRHLDAIVSYTEELGALPVLVMPVANDAGFEPNRSFLPATTRRAERDAFRRAFENASRLEAGNPDAAIAAFYALVARYPAFAESHFRLARLLEAAGRSAEAYEHFVAARDLDGYPMRCTSSFQDVYRGTAARHDCILIDSQTYFHAIGHHGQLDEHLFSDGLHPSLRGQIALVQAILHELKNRAAFGWPKEAAPRAIDPAECAEHFGLVPQAWRYVCVWGMMFYDLCHPMRYDPAPRLQRKQAFADAAARIDAGAAPESLGLPNIGVPEPVPLLPAIPGQNINLRREPPR
jgi:hypothetical protein